MKADGEEVRKKTQRNHKWQERFLRTLLRTRSAQPNSYRDEGDQRVAQRTSKTEYYTVSKDGILNVATPTRGENTILKLFSSR